jgi:hypothetical protein
MIDFRSLNAVALLITDRRWKKSDPAVQHRDRHPHQAGSSDIRGDGNEIMLNT